MSTTPTIQRLLVIPTASGGYTTKVLPSTAQVQAKDANGNAEVTPQLDASGSPVSIAQTNPDGTSTSSVVMVPVMTTASLAAPKINGLAFTVDISLPTTPAATNAAIQTALAAFKSAHPTVFPASATSAQ